MKSSQFGLENLLEESLDDSFRPIGNIDKGVFNNPPPHVWNPLIERYVREKVALYVSISEGPFGDSLKNRTSKYGVLFYRPTVAFILSGGPERNLDWWKGKVEFLPA